MTSRDPVCGMTVDTEKAAAKVTHAGKDFYFCCARCAEKFRADPEKYLNATAVERMHAGAAPQLIQLGGIKPAGTTLTTIAPAKPSAPTAEVDPAAISSQQNDGHDHASTGQMRAQQKVAYVCPMCPEVREERPVACPKCGMTLEPEMPLAPATRTEYTCPMHPEIVRSEPGPCPICGMALEPRTAVVEDQENPELVSMTRRFWVGLALTVPVFALEMSDMLPGDPLHRVLSMSVMGWIE
jgi:Cu+-exporting ATPase